MIKNLTSLSLATTLMKVQQGKKVTKKMGNLTTKFIALITMLIFYGNMNAQCDYQSFNLNDVYKGFETADGTGYVEKVINDSASIDSYISSVYATLSENYPQANIKTIGNRVIRMDATSLGISVSDKATPGMLKMYVDFSMTIEIREKTINTYQWIDSTGIKHTKTSVEDRPCVRFYAPSVKKLTFYDPYYHPEIREYITKPREMYEVLMEKGFSDYRPMSCDFISEIDIYIIGNIHAETNQNYYKTYRNGEFYDTLGRKHKRSKK